MHRITSTAPSITAACARLKPDEGRMLALVHAPHQQHRALAGSSACDSSLSSTWPGHRPGAMPATRSAGTVGQGLAAGHAAGEHARIDHDVSNGMAGGDDVSRWWKWADRDQHTWSCDSATPSGARAAALARDGGHHGFEDRVIH